MRRLMLSHREKSCRLDWELKDWEMLPEASQYAPRRRAFAGDQS